MKNSFYHLVFLVTILYFLPLKVFAEEAKARTKTKVSAKYECKLISRAEAINQARRKVDGKVVGVQLSERGNRSVYRVRMLVDKNRVKNISINACR